MTSVISDHRAAPLAVDGAEFLCQFPFQPTSRYQSPVPFAVDSTTMSGCCAIIERLIERRRNATLRVEIMRAVGADILEDRDGTLAILLNLALPRRKTRCIFQAVKIACEGAVVKSPQDRSFISNPPEVTRISQQCSALSMVVFDGQLCATSHSARCGRNCSTACRTRERCTRLRRRRTFTSAKA